MYKKLLITLALFLLTAGTANAALSTGTLEKGLVGHWALDNVTKAKDLTSYSNHGTAQGGVTIGGTTDQHGQAGRATTFTAASSQYINMGNRSSLDALSNITISAWVKPTTSASGYGTIAKKDSGNDGFLYYAGYGSSVNQRIFIDGSRVTSNTPLTQNVWQFITVTYNQSNATFYLNGVVDGSPAIALGAINTNTASFLVGGIEGGSEFWTGSISDVRVYNRALSAAEITQLYNSYRPKIQINSTLTTKKIIINSLSKGLVGYWKLDNITGARDKSAYGNHGTGSGGISIGGATDRKTQAGRATAFASANTQFITVPNSASLSPAKGLTISAWVKPSDSDWNEIVLKPSSTSWSSPYGDYSLRLYSSTGNIGFWVQNFTNEIQGSAVDTTGNVWTHIVATWDGTTERTYKNGVVSATTAAVSGSITNSGQPLLIGKDLSPNYFSGSIGEVRIYDRALTQAEITLLYQSYTPNN